MAQPGGLGPGGTGDHETPEPAMVRPMRRRLALLSAAALLAGTTVMSEATPPEPEPVVDYLREPVLLESDQVAAIDEPQMGLSPIPVSITLAKLPGPDPFEQADAVGPADPADDPVCLSYPVAPGSYRISSPYGYRIHPIFGSYAMHAGVDFAAPLGTPIHAVTDGTVVYTGAGRLGRSSELVILEHTVGDTTFYSWYVHMYPDGVFVEVGQRVRAGEVIAEVGNNGNSTGPHLHFEIHTEDVVLSSVPRTPTANPVALLDPDDDSVLDPDEESAEDETEGSAEDDESGDGEAEGPGDGEAGEPGDDEAEGPGDDEAGEPGDDEAGEPGDDEAEGPGDDEAGEPGDGETEAPRQEPGEGEAEGPGDGGSAGPTQEPGDGEAEGPGDGETEAPTQEPGDGEAEGPGDGETAEPTEPPTQPGPRPTGEPADPSADGPAGEPQGPAGTPAAPGSAGEHGPETGGTPPEGRDRGESARQPFPVRAFGTTVEPMDFLRSLGLVMVAPDKCLAQ